MPHDPLLAQSTVYVWMTSVSSRRAGHAAIKVSDGKGGYAFLSFWGDHNPAGPGANSIQHLADALVATGRFGKGAASHIAGGYTTDPQNIGKAPVFDNDAQHEGSKPSYRCRILRGLNFSKMLALAQKWRSGDIEYDLRSSNCCHAVANVLNAGEPPIKVPLTGTFTNTWIPYNVQSYCISLVKTLNASYPGSALQNSGNGWV